MLKTKQNNIRFHSKNKTTNLNYNKVSFDNTSKSNVTKRLQFTNRILPVQNPTVKHPVYVTFYLTAVCKNRQLLNYQNNRRFTQTNNLRGVVKRPLSLIPFPKCSYIYFSDKTNINSTISRSFTSPPRFLLRFGSGSCQTGFA